jgi:hypothetical protein
MNEEEKNELKKLGVSIEFLELANEPVEPSKMRPAAAIGLGAFCLLNFGVLLSLPPVLRGRGTSFSTAGFHKVLLFRTHTLMHFVRSSVSANLQEEFRRHVLSAPKRSHPSAASQIGKETLLCRPGKWRRSSGLSSCKRRDISQMHRL